MTEPKGDKTRHKTTNWTVCRRQKTLRTHLPYCASTTALNLLVDSTGIKFLGERVMARTFERQVVELRVRVALLKRFAQLGRPTTVPVVAMVQPRLGWGSPRFALDLCNKADPSMCRIPHNAAAHSVYSG